MTMLTSYSHIPISFKILSKPAFRLQLLEMISILNRTPIDYYSISRRAQTPAKPDARFNAVFVLICLLKL
jgi:hypothetical protein